MSRIFFALFCLLSSVVLGEDEQFGFPIEHTGLSAKLEARLDGPWLTEFPLVFKLTMTNTSEKPIYYWCGGPDQYPPATNFTAELTNEKGETLRLPLTNGQYEVGSGINLAVKTPQEFPAVCEPIAAGKYTLRISGRTGGYRKDGKIVETWPAMKSEPMMIEVVEDHAAVIEREKKFTENNKRTPFMRHVSVRYGFDPDVKTWLEQLLSNDVKTVTRGLGELNRVQRFPSGADVILKQAAIRRGTQASINVKRPSDLLEKAHRPDRFPDQLFVQIVRRLRTDAALDTLLIFVDDDAVDKYAREHTIQALANFPQPRAKVELLRVIKDRNHPAYWSAIRSLAYLRSQEALNPLLKQAVDEDRRKRAFAIRALTWLREEPESRRAIENALTDRDEYVRRCAKEALERDLNLPLDITW